MIKAIPNRTIGLQKKTIQDSHYESDCEMCEGKGVYSINLKAGAIRNLKSHAGHTLDIECTNPDCNNGKVRTKLRVIRKNKIAAIL